MISAPLSVIEVRHIVYALALVKGHVTISVRAISVKTSALRVASVFQSQANV
jgi:hypothetical protein